MKVYADNAATTPVRSEVLEEMLRSLRETYGNPSSLHAWGQEAARGLISARESVAKSLHAAPGEIFFTSGGTEADNQAILTAARLGAAQGKRHLISDRIEHHAVLRPLERLAREGFDITLLEVPADGIVRPQDVAAAIQKDTALVSVMYANNELGTIQPVEEIGRICRERAVLFHTDAVQAAGHIPVFPAEASADLLTLSAHKFYGPKGVGALYVRKGIEAASLLEGGAQERGKRAGTENLPCIAGMAKALEMALEEMDAERERLLRLRELLTDGLLAVPRSALNGDPKRRLPGHANFLFDGVRAETLLLLLDESGIAASAGAACASGAALPSHVLTAIGRSGEEANASIRFSLGRETTEEDVLYIIEQVTACVRTLRGG